MKEIEKKTEDSIKVKPKFHFIASDEYEEKIKTLVASGKKLMPFYVMEPINSRIIQRILRICFPNMLQIITGSLSQIKWERSPFTIHQLTGRSILCLAMLLIVLGILLLPAKIWLTSMPMADLKHWRTMVIS